MNKTALSVLNNGNLIRYESARAALMAAVNVDEVKDIRDKALAIEAYARQAQDGELIEMATEIRCRAERRCGEMLADGPKNTGSMGIGKSVLPDGKRTREIPTLADMGISEKQSSRWQKLARISEEKFEEAVAAAKEIAHDVSATAVLSHQYRAQGSGENEWYTPPDVLVLVRQVFTEIDLDPASSEEANKTVRAKTFYTVENDGLDKPWHGRVWLNPPYSRDLMPKFVEKVITEFLSGRVSEAMLVSHNNTDTAWFQSLAKACRAMCFPSTRIKFYRGETVASPVNGQVFFYLGNEPALFCGVFSKIGIVMTPYAA